jgi:hypothetical protein
MNLGRQRNVTAFQWRRALGRRWASVALDAVWATAVAAAVWATAVGADLSSAAEALAPGEQSVVLPAVDLAKSAGLVVHDCRSGSSSQSELRAGTCRTDST